MFPSFSENKRAYVILCTIGTTIIMYLGVLIAGLIGLQDSSISILGDMCKIWTGAAIGIITKFIGQFDDHSATEKKTDEK